MLPVAFCFEKGDIPFIAPEKADSAIAIPIDVIFDGGLFMYACIKRDGKIHESMLT
jgi:hypothetical protein